MQYACIPECCVCLPSLGYATQTIQYNTWVYCPSLGYVPSGPLRPCFFMKSTTWNKFNIYYLYYYCHHHHHSWHHNPRHHLLLVHLAHSKPTSPSNQNKRPCLWHQCWRRNYVLPGKGKQVQYISVGSVVALHTWYTPWQDCAVFQPEYDECKGGRASRSRHAQCCAAIVELVQIWSKD